MHGGAVVAGKPTLASLLTVVGTFGALALWFVLDPVAPDLGIPAPAVASRAPLPPGPIRQRMPDPPTITLSGYDRDCMDCHQIFDGARRYEDRLMQHTDIDLDHGEALEGRCLVCHAEKDRNRLAIHGEKTVSFDEVSQLCGKCHGPAYRDWQGGMHGRTTGSWDPESGRQSRLQCTDCHHPHRPRYGQIAPLPGPNTRLMGEPHPAEHGHEDNPLMRRAQP